MWRVLVVMAASPFVAGSCAKDPAAGTGEAPDLSVPAARFSDEGAPRRLDAVARAVEAVDGTRIDRDIARLAAFPTRNTCSDNTPAGNAIGAARDLVAAELAAVAGVQQRLDPFAVADCDNAMRDNVVAWLPGTRADRLIVVGGHYDSRTVDVLDGKAAAPGANDSGSQTAVVMEVARALAAARPAAGYDATLVFVAFAGEEQGLVGSTAFVKGLPRSFPGATVEAMLNCDVVGGDRDANDAAALATFRLYSPGTPREIKGADGTPDDISPSRNLMRVVGAVAATYVPTMTMTAKLREDRPGRGSDHESFIAARLPAVRFIEPNETLGHQHTPDDHVEFVTPGYAGRVARVVTATAALLASSPAAPAAATVEGNAAGVSLRFAAAPPAGFHYVVAVRGVGDTVYSRRLRVEGVEPLALAAGDLGVGGGDFYATVAVADEAGRMSGYAYPEVRCAADGCAIPTDANNITATR